MKSNSFTMEWPPRSGRMHAFPEADRGAWYPLEEAETKIAPGQGAFLEELRRLIVPAST
jgi:predicted NUDIX family NTP pyrophosphohydrolase